MLQFSGSLGSYRVEDPAIVAFAPLITLVDASSASLAARAGVHWLRCAHDVDDLGASGLVPPGTRLRLQRIGLASGSLPKLEVDGDRWASLVARHARGELSCGEGLYLARLLLYLDFVDEAEAAASRALEAATTLEQRAWGHLIVHWAREQRAPGSTIPEQLEAITGVRALGPGSLLLHLAMELAAQFAHQGAEARAAALLDQAERGLYAAEVTARGATALAAARLALLRAEHAAMFASDAGQLDTVCAALCGRGEAELRFDGGAHANLGMAFLASEWERNVHAFAARLHRARNDWATALDHAVAAAQLDRASAGSLLAAAAIAERAGRDELATKYLQQASRAGLAERCEAQLASARLDRDPVTDQLELIEGVEAALATGDAPRTASAWIASLPQAGPGASSLAGWIAELRPAAGASGARERPPTDVLAHSETYFRCRPYWELCASSDAQAPRHTLTPLIAWRVYKERRSPWFESLYTQRGMGPAFRAELYFACAPDLASAQAGLDHGTSLASLRGRSEDADELVELYARRETLTALDHAYLARSLGALGFFHEALEVAPMPDPGRAWSVEEQYLASTILYLRTGYELDEPLQEPRDLRMVFDKLVPDKRNLRIRLVLAILGLAFCARKRYVPGVAHWRAEALHQMQLVRDSGRFTDFDLGVLESRLYRATSFYPFLLDDEPELRREIELCEQIARGVRPTSALEVELDFDNLFACLESIARTYASLGEGERAARYMEEITTFAPHDTKAWMQSADMWERNGELERATAGFVMASRFGPSQAAVACFRAARGYERLGQPERAKAFHLRSLRMNPGGTSPMFRLARLAQATGDTYLRDWTEQALRRMRATVTLSDRMLQELDDVLRDTDADAA